MIFTGRVQGVGFRYNTHRTADHHAVTGFVRNLSDGSVELVVEGTSSVIDQFLQAIRDRMDGLIADFTTENLAPNGEFTHFEIR